MTSTHLPEPALQAAAESLASLPAPQAAHLHTCLQCQRQVAAYRQLYVAAAQLPPPTFAFDLAASVLAQLPKPAAKPVLTWALGLVVALVAGVLAVFTLLFGGILAQAMQGVFTVLGAGLGIAAGIFLTGQCLELLAQHRRHMRLLAFS